MVIWICYTGNEMYFNEQSLAVRFPSAYSFQVLYLFHSDSHWSCGWPMLFHGNNVLISVVILKSLYIYAFKQSVFHFIQGHFLQVSFFSGVSDSFSVTLCSLKIIWFDLFFCSLHSGVTEFAKRSLSARSYLWSMRCWKKKQQGEYSSEGFCQLLFVPSSTCWVV